MAFASGGDEAGDRLIEVEGDGVDIKALRVERGGGCGCDVGWLVMHGSSFRGRGIGAMKVLIADDDRVLTRLATAGLKSRGWQVEVAHDAMQALMFAMRVPPPDVIALDIGMPGGTGFEVLKKLQQSSRTGQIPVVVVSGSITEADEARVTEFGAVAFLRKPTDPQVLHDTLLRAAGLAGG